MRYHLTTARLLTIVGITTALALPATAALPEDTPDGTLRKHATQIGSLPFGFFGEFWVDTGYMQRKNAREGQYDQDAQYMQGRFVLGTEYYQEFGGMFATARAELLGFVNEYTKSQFEPHVQDAYVMFGQEWWDIQVGRFLAWEVYRRGQGIELYTAEETGALNGPGLYWLDLARGHRNEAGQAAVHFYPTDFLSIELAGVYGQEQNQNLWGVRPAIDLHYRGFRLLGGFEYLAQRPQTDNDKVETTSMGYAAQLRWEHPFVTVGADFGMVNIESYDINGDREDEKTLDKTSVGGFVDVNFWRSSVGLGYHYTTQDNKQNETNEHHQMFVSYLVRLPVEGLSLKAVYGYATAHIQDIDVQKQWDNSMHSGRLRIAYSFN